MPHPPDLRRLRRTSPPKDRQPTRRMLKPDTKPPRSYAPRAPCTGVHGPRAARDRQGCSARAQQQIRHALEPVSTDIKRPTDAVWASTLICCDAAPGRVVLIAQHDEHDATDRPSVITHRAPNRSDPADGHPRSQRGIIKSTDPHCVEEGSPWGATSIVHLRARVFS